jgi:hypothetical protein
MSQYDLCPKWNKCSAPICPLDDEWDRRRMLADEPVCFYLLEHAKEGSKARFEERGLRELYEVMIESSPSSHLSGGS